MVRCILKVFQTFAFMNAIRLNKSQTTVIVFHKVCPYILSLTGVFYIQQTMPATLTAKTAII